MSEKINGGYRYVDNAKAQASSTHEGWWFPNASSLLPKYSKPGVLIRKLCILDCNLKKLLNEST